MIVLDTNVLSEAFRPAPASTVLRWLGQQQASSVFITSVTQAEVLYGLEGLPAGSRKAKLADAIEKVLAEEFRGRILPFDEDAAQAYAKIVAARDALGRPISQFDAMIAAITRGHRAVLATRNTSDFQHCGLDVVNPWTP